MNSDSLDHVFAALADPTRRAILARLALGNATVNELVKPFGLAQPTISKHLKVLERAGLVSRSRDAQFRPVRLNAAPLESAARWIGGYKQFWENSLDRLDQYVRELHAKGKGHARGRKPE
jgi:DNA-binding transcriptional ArsR family regulator